MNLIIYKFIINVRAMRGIFGNLSVRDLDHCEADDAFAHDKAGLEYLRDDVFSEVLVLDVHHGVVALRVKRLAGHTKRLDVHGLEDLYKLPHGHFHALFIGFVSGLVLERALEVVIDRKEFLRCLGLGILIDAVLLFGRTLAEIIKFRRQPQILVMLLCLRGKGFFQLGRFFFLRFGVLVSASGSCAVSTFSSTCACSGSFFILDNAYSSVFSFASGSSGFPNILPKPSAK